MLAQVMTQSWQSITKPRRKSGRNYLGLGVERSTSLRLTPRVVPHGSALNSLFVSGQRKRSIGIRGA